MFLWSVILTTMIYASLACNPDFCIGRADGEFFCDPADSASSYRCVFSKAFHFTCGAGTVYDGSVCNWPNTACITNPVPDPVPGEVVGGICVPIAGTGTTGSAGNIETTLAIETTETTGSASSLGTTAMPSSTEGSEQGVFWGIYRRYPNTRSTCTLTQKILVARPIPCGSACSITEGCTGFNLYRSPSNVVGGKRYECELLACQNDHMLSGIAGHHYYDQL
ncbi:uncharacterized protein [Haliotis cracherodii]|uniref:uncharacterized protein n=1 Tax=Haliotis cracherodii TaxID=6455 RepID=UPI0039E9E379